MNNRKKYNFVELFSFIIDKFHRVWFNRRIKNSLYKLYKSSLAGHKFVEKFDETMST